MVRATATGLAAAALISMGCLSTPPDSPAPAATLGPWPTPTQRESEARALMADTGMAVDFDLPTLDGESLALSDLAGSVVILNFWASWCGPCRWEMPLLERIYREYAGRDLIVVVAVKDDEESARQFAREAEISYPLGLDRTGVIARDYGAFVIPVTFFIGAGGSVERKLMHVVDEDTLRQMVEGHLSAAGSGGAR